MSLTEEQIAEIRARAEAATPGPWYHCQPFQTVPAQRTVHGPVPEQRVDYVSTWEGPGTPKGHSVVAHMDGCEAGMRSKDMAFIAAANPAVVLALISSLESQAAELAEVWQQYVDANEARIDAETQLAEARKPLERDELKARVAELEAALRTIARHPIENFCMGRPDLGIPGYASCQDVARAILKGASNEQR